jgi:hypothetical protein
MKNLVIAIFLIGAAFTGYAQEVVAPVTETEHQEKSAYDMANAAWEQIEKKDFTGAIATCKEGLKLDAENYYLLANFAHASLLAGNYDDAMSIYKLYYGRPFNELSTWKEMIKTDLDSFKAKGFETVNIDKAFAELKSLD